MRILAALCLCAASATVAHGETLGYGSRAGMEVTVVSKSNLGTSHAIINVKHTKANAVAYCRDYVGKVTPRCVSDELKVPLAVSISANCKTGKFSTLNSEGFTFSGPNPNHDPNDSASQPEYLLLNSNGESIGGSSADGYDVALEQFKALCPRSVK
ncbi:hypothetical protein LGH82_01845 [Mesorhizobium sp. PAMC28654]|uniref:hypothetical protein n=1 Tax=Mesorhizobium sp. PAMC28654 TaxID=2880934 RepID=UPI001D09F405|nr:hypothetical protein [Mesorhizobium sp. PAMC28654]UDL90167.1 hypothetical protein LGH82_01845 [Mesorhizobium sp. PAMC28654]